MSNTRRIVLLVTILLILVFPARLATNPPGETYCKGNLFSFSSRDNSAQYCRYQAGLEREAAAKLLLLITVGGIAAWVLLPGKKPDTE